MYCNSDGALISKENIGDLCSLKLNPGSLQLGIRDSMDAQIKV